MLIAIALLAAVAGLGTGQEKPLMHAPFPGKLETPWRWIRENPKTWRISEEALEIMVEPGNLWGGANDARNVLVHPLPVAAGGKVTASVTVANKPTHQYEQVNLVWYYDDSNMVKIGLELVDGRRCLVMGREENDKTQTLALIPVDSDVLEVRLVVEQEEIRGYYRVSREAAWKEAGTGILPGKGEAHLSIQAYQGPPDAEHWARISELRIVSEAPGSASALNSPTVTE